MTHHLYPYSSDEFPDLNPGWVKDGGSLVLSNPKFGQIFHAVVRDETGKALYDQPVWAEPIGAIIIPITSEDKIAFVNNYRPASPPEGTYGTYPPSTQDLQMRGRFSLELPRGFAEPGESSMDTAIRETQEETGYEVIEAVCLGKSNSNTTFFLNDMPVWLVKVTRSSSLTNTPDKHENIQGMRFLKLAEALELLKMGKISCGITKSALLHYLAWSLPNI
jgi:8-oxo-dGTP pyrophosphatase MutT (NUDIX family)